MADPLFRRKVEEIAGIMKEYQEAKTWFEQSHPQSPLGCVAYFRGAAHIFGRTG
jgi:starch phosphorylase